MRAHWMIVLALALGLAPIAAVSPVFAQENATAPAEPAAVTPGRTKMTVEQRLRADSEANRAREERTRRDWFGQVGLAVRAGDLAALVVLFCQPIPLLVILLCLVAIGRVIRRR